MCVRIDSRYIVVISHLELGRQPHVGQDCILRPISNRPRAANRETIWSGPIIKLRNRPIANRPQVEKRSLRPSAPLRSRLGNRLRAMRREADCKSAAGCNPALHPIGLRRISGAGRSGRGGRLSRRHNRTYRALRRREAWMPNRDRCPSRACGRGASSDEPGADSSHPLLR